MKPARQYLFRSSEGESVLVFRGTNAAKMVGGGGGWDTVARPRRAAITQWNGRDPYAMDVPVLFDGWRDNDNVEPDIARLNQMQMGKPRKTGPDSPPPTVQIDGAVPIKGATWVITSIDWGDNVIWHPQGDDGYRLRQDAVVHLLQFVAEERLAISAAKLSPGQLYTTKEGDTLIDVAKKYYGDARKAKVIGRANKIRNVHKKLKKGTHLKIPTPMKHTAHPVQHPKPKAHKKK